MRSDEELKCRTISSQYLIRRPWLTVRKDDISLPDGRENPEYYVLEYPDWVNIIAIDSDGCFLLERQWRHAAATVSTEIPAGVIEQGETPLEAAKRELAEETGCSGGEWEEIMKLYPNPGLMNNVCHCFLARGVEKTAGQHLDDTEDLEVFTATEQEVKNMLESGRFMQAMMAAPLWKYFYAELKAQ